MSGHRRVAEKIVQNTKSQTNLRAVLARPCERRDGPARAAQRAGMDSLSTTLSRFRAVQEATAHNNAAIELLHVGR